MPNNAPVGLSGISGTLKAQLAFTCAYEKDRNPPLDPDADKLFKHARYLQKKNLLKEDRQVYPEVERLYRIAAAHGHYKAAHNLIVFLVRSRTDAEDRVTLPAGLAEGMIRAGIPQGYFDMGYLLHNGYGVKMDAKASLKYFRKAADLGSAEAQWYIGDKLSNFGFANPVPYEIGNAMIRCAGDQGHGKAAQDTAILLKLDAKDLAPPLAEKNRADALRYYQAAIKAGVPTAGLENAFARVPDELGVQKDEERARRYTIITNILEGYSYASPMVEELDEIVPLPPAPLPEWDGKLKWLEEWEKGTPPPLPEEERIREMAHSKGLDPATGRPLKLTPEPKAEAEVPPAPPPRLATGGPCPRTGYWRCVEDGKTLRFVEGQLMPPAVFYKPANGLLNRLRGIEREYSHNGPGHWDWVGEGNKG